MQNTLLRKYHQRKKKIDEFITDETLVKVGSEFIWLWVAIEAKNKKILAEVFQKSEICL
jgi:putative transposase